MKAPLRKIAIKCFSFLLLLVLLYGCIKEEFNPSKLDTTLDLHSGLAIPVGFSHLGFEKYLSDSTYDELNIGKDGFLSLCYSAIIDSGVMADILSITDISVNSSILNQTGSLISLNIPGATLDLTDTIVIPITGNNATARIDSIKLISGTLYMDISSANISGTVTFQLNGLRQNGIPFSTVRNLINPDLSLPLENYSIIPEHDLSGNNLLKCSISIHLQSPSGPINAGASIMDIQTDLSSLRYETIFGDFNGYIIDFPAKTIPTPFFRQLTAGQILFTDPKFKFFFSNSVGVPLGVSFSQIDAIDRNTDHHPLTGPGVPVATNPKVIKYPSLSQVGVTIADSLIIDKNNSNLVDFIAASPNSIEVRASAEIVQINPPATTFISHDSKYKISSTIELPLWGMADFLILLDTLDFDYLNSSLPPPAEIEKLIVRTSVTNSFPVTVYPQIYFLDGNSALLDSLYTGAEKIDGASDTNGDGITDPYHQPPIDIELPQSTIDNIQNTRYIVVKSRILTTDFPDQEVKLYSSNFLDYSVGLIAQLKIKIGK